MIWGEKGQVFNYLNINLMSFFHWPSLNLSILAGGRIIGFISFPTVLVLYEMLSVLSMIWTRVAVSISCDDNHYTTGTSLIYED